jgi:hypothetical protein
LIQLTLTKSLRAAIIPEGNILLDATVRAIRSAGVDKKSDHKVFGGGETLFVSLVHLDAFLIWKVFVNDFGMGSEGFV